MCILKGYVFTMYILKGHIIAVCVLKAGDATDAARSRGGRTPIILEDRGGNMRKAPWNCWLDAQQLHGAFLPMPFSGRNNYNGWREE